MDNIKITLETLYDILRNEKKKEDLQKLEQTFFVDVLNYLKEKKSLLGMKSDENELFAAGEKEKIEYELRSIKRILKQLYEKREKKIIDIALNRSRTGSDIIDTSSMLKEEKEFYNKILDTLDVFRRSVLLNLFRGEIPNVEVAETPSLERKKEQIMAELEESSDGRFEGDEESKEEIIEKEGEASKEETKSEKTKIRFIHPMPSFVWKDMKVYGPYDKGEETVIFPEVAELLVRKGRAEKV